MTDSAKYLIHAEVTADGVVERSDVVGAVFGQTEGLLGEDLDIRSLQQSSKLGRIDVEIDSRNGRSFGEMTIASSLDRVETATLAAGLETISRVGPCRATVRITGIEDVRSAKRREVVDRATQLLDEAFDDTVLTSDDILAAVRERVRAADVTEYEGLPAGPRVGDSDAVVVVEGRADVVSLLGYGIKNAIAVEGTNVPDAVAELTNERTTTAFLDGDRGGDLILKELAQVGDVDYVAFAPSGRSVEDLPRHEVTAALRQKVPYETVAEASVPREAAGTADGGAAAGNGGAAPVGAPGGEETAADPSEAVAPAGGVAGEGGAVVEEGVADDAGGVADDAGGVADAGEADDAAPETNGASVEGADAAVGEGGARDAEGAAPDAGADVDAEADADAEAGVDAHERGDPDARGDADESTDGEADAAAGDEPETLRDHVAGVVGADTGRVRLLDDAFGTLAEADAEGAFEAIEGADRVPAVVVLDGELTQRVLDVAAQRGVGQVVARSQGEFTKKPATVRVRTADQLLSG